MRLIVGLPDGLASWNNATDDGEGIARPAEALLGECALVADDEASDGERAVQ